MRKTAWIILLLLALSVCALASAQENPSLAIVSSAPAPVGRGEEVTLTATPSSVTSAQYRWYSCDALGRHAELIAGATESAYAPDTGAVGTSYYRCALEGVLSPVVQVTVLAQGIEFTVQPQDASVSAGSINAALTAEAYARPSGDKADLVWYPCTAQGTVFGGQLGAGGSFAVPHALARGTCYYLCRASAAGAPSVDSRVVKVEVGPQASPTAGSASLVIRTASGNTVALEINTLFETVNGLKDSIQSALGYAPADQVLTYAGTLLENGKELSEYAIPSGATLDLVGAYRAAVTLTKDGAPYTGQTVSLRAADTYALAEGAGGTYTAARVPEGTYDLYLGETPTAARLTIAGAAANATFDFFTVSFEPDGGTPAPASQLLVKGGKVAQPTGMTKPGGYVVGRWYSDDKLVTPWNFAADTVRETMTLYPEWVFEITITEEPNDLSETEGSVSGTLRASATVSDGGEATLTWYVCDANGNVLGGAVAVGGAFEIPKDLGAGIHYFICRATYPGAEDVDTRVARVTVAARPKIVFTLQPAPLTEVTEGRIVQTLTAAAGEATLTWYACDADGNVIGEALATGGAFAIPADLKVGTVYYICKASYPGAADVFSSIAVVVVRFPVTGIRMVETREMVVGESVYMSCELEPAGALLKHLTWTSDNPAIATVDANGLVTARTPGETVITGQSGGVSDACAVTVIQKETDTRVPTRALTVGKGNKLDLNDLAGGAYVWESGDTAIATVSKKGVLTGKKIGQVTVTGTLGGAVGKSAVVGDAVELTVNIVKKGEAVNKIALAPKKLSLAVGETGALTATVTPKSAVNKFLTWTSADARIAAVDADGTVTGIATGVTEVTATATSGVSKSVAVTVTGSGNAPTATAAEIALSPDARTQKVGERLALNLTVTPANADVTGLTWTSADPAIATVDAGGWVTGVSQGETLITARLGTLEANCRITVEKGGGAEQVLKLYVDFLVIAKGKVVELTDLIGFAGSWTVADQEIASLTDGVLRARKTGETALTFRVGKVEKKGARFMEKSLEAGDSVTVRLIVVPKGYAVKKVKLPKSVTLAQGETLTLAPTITPKRARYRQLFYRSDDPSVATVDEAGQVTARAPGNAAITVVATTGVMATCVVSVR